MSQKLRINERCIQCGSCLGLGYDFLESSEDGSVSVKLGTLVNGETVKQLKEICPVQAFEVEENVSKTKTLIELRQKLINVKGCVVPTCKDISFDSEQYHIPTPIATGEYRYEYSSDNAAERAALSEFRNKMYSQIDNLILKVITEYRVTKIKPYYTKNIEEGSVYAKKNAEVNAIIEGLRNVLADKTPKTLKNISIYPDDDITWKMLNKGEVVSTELISDVRNEFDYDADSYSCYWDTDYSERMVGKNMFGNYKTKDMYCYKNLNNAFKELSKDLNKALGWSKDKIVGRAIEFITYLVEDYNKHLHEEINKIVKLFDTILESTTETLDFDEDIKLPIYAKLKRELWYDEEIKRIKMNGKEIKENECVVAGDNNVQIWYDGFNLYKKYVDRKYNSINEQIIFPDNSFNDAYIIGRGNNVIIVDNNKKLYSYFVKEDKVYTIENYVNGGACMLDNTICYQKPSNPDDPYDSKTLHLCNFKGENNIILDRVFYSRDLWIFRNVHKENDKLKYTVKNIMRPDQSYDKEIDIKNYDK